MGRGSALLGRINNGTKTKGARPVFRAPFWKRNGWTPMKHYYDVIVVGGGPAGIMSAMASGKLGASTLLIEKNGFLGGAATAAVLGPISPFHYKDEQVIDGLPQAFMDRLVAAKGSTGHMKTIDPYGSGDSLGFYDREKYKYVAAEMLLELGVDILYHSSLLSVRMEGNRVCGLTTVSK